MNNIDAIIESAKKSDPEALSYQMTDEQDELYKNPERANEINIGETYFKYAILCLEAPKPGYQSAKHYFKKAYESGFQEAKNYIDMPFKLLEEKAEKGDASAMYELYEIYSSKAELSLEASAKKGFKEAQVSLAKEYTDYFSPAVRTLDYYRSHSPRIKFENTLETRYDKNGIGFTYMQYIVSAMYIVNKKEICWLEIDVLNERLTNWNGNFTPALKKHLKSLKINMEGFYYFFNEDETRCDMVRLDD